MTCGKQARGALSSANPFLLLQGRAVQGLAKKTLTGGRKCDLRVFVLNTLSSFTA